MINWVIKNRKRLIKNSKQPTRRKPTKQSIRDKIAEKYEGVLFMDPPEVYDKAIVGVLFRYDNAVVVYDYKKVITANMKQGMTREEAEEHFSYNQVGSYVGDHTPIFIDREWMAS